MLTVCCERRERGSKVFSKGAGAKECKGGKIIRRDQDEYLLCSPVRSHIFRGHETNVSSRPSYQIFLGYQR